MSGEYSCSTRWRTFPGDETLVAVAGHLFGLSPVVFRPFQVLAVSASLTYTASSSRLPISWHQGSQGAFKRVMTVRSVSMTSFHFV